MAVICKQLPICLRLIAICVGLQMFKDRLPSTMHLVKLFLFQGVKFEKQLISGGSSG